MQRTRLVQRLNLPLNQEVTIGSTTFKPHHIFGGGNLGLTKEAWELLDPIFTIDFMGAAEYEFGVIPATINNLLQDRENLVAFSFVIKAKNIKASFGREMAYKEKRRKELADAKAKGIKAKRAKPVRAENDATIYVLCRNEHKDEVELVIRDLALDKVDTKERSLFSEALDTPPINERSRLRDLRGWLELDNGFFFFTDEQMWHKTCKLFGVDNGSHSG